MNIPENIGERGEAIFRVLLTRQHPSRGYLFEHPRFLGDKKRTIDFYVELFHSETITPFFFVQVKSTSLGYTVKDHRLNSQIRETAMKRLAAYPAPTYIIGIDEPGEKGYLLSANGEWKTGLTSFPTTYPINSDTLALLWNEVAEYCGSKQTYQFSNQPFMIQHGGNNADRSRTIY